MTLSTAPGRDIQQRLLLVNVKLCGQLQGPKSQEIPDSIRHGRPKGFQIVGVISATRDMESI